MNKELFKSDKTVHTARTIMFEELSIIMNYTEHLENPLVALEQNVSGKQTMKNLNRTNAALKTLYVFDNNFIPFVLFKHFWQISEESDKNYLTLIFAIGTDYLFRDSKDIILSLQPGESVKSSTLAQFIASKYENKFTPITMASASRNLISSWKQVNYLSKGKNNIRLKTAPGIHAVTFAFLISYLNGDRGSFLFQSQWVKVLDCSDDYLHNSLMEASGQDLLAYKSSGSVRIINFDNFLGKLGMYGLQS